MDIIPQSDSQQPISDDQELAKALAGVLPDVAEPVAVSTTSPVVDTPAVAAMPTPTLPGFQPAVMPVSVAPTAVSVTTPPTELESIKKNALIELRPLIGKVELPPEEKFDTYLMLIRSTDDSSLVGPAHEIAQTITDEKKRAEALLDIIKEIDYLSHAA